MNDQGFIDLRLNRQEGQTSENFWPSFTDIMTVIVTIFLIAMVVVLLRNLELVNQLRATMEAEREAMELARTTGEQKESLALRLNDAENELSSLRMKNLLLEEQKAALDTRSSDQEKRIGALTGERDGLSAKVVTLETAKTLQMKEVADLRSTLSGSEQQLKNATNQNKETAAELASLRITLAETERNFANLKGRAKQLETDLATERAAQAGSAQQLTDLQLRLQTLTNEHKGLRGNYDKQKLELEETRSKISVTDKRLADLQGNFDDLQVKYDRLVRPARTSNGKQVVEVRYFKSGNGYRIEYKEPGQTDVTTVSQQALEQRLTQLRNKDPDHLYIKVVFPEKSGLTYAEAWSFTSHLHKNYDYYFREAAPAPGP